MKALKYIGLALALVMLSGCNDRETPKQTAARWSDNGQARLDRAGEACKNGVVYYVTYYDRSFSITPAYNPDSTVKTCK